MKKICLFHVVLTVLTSILILNSCSTIQSVMSDIQNVGQGITTPSRYVNVEVTDTRLVGDKFYLDFIITYAGEKISSYGIGITKETYDNLGNQCNMKIIFGNSETSFGMNDARNPLPENIPVKATVVVTGFSSKATSFTQITVSGKNWGYEKNTTADGNFIFRNVPIVR